MLDQEENIEDLDEAVAPGPPRGMSIIDQIVAQETEQRPLELPIPRFNGRVVVRYNTVNRRVMLNAARVKSLTRQNAAILVAACREVLIRDENGKLVTIQEKFGLPTPVRFDGQLAEFFRLGDDTLDQIDIVIRMFRNDVPIDAQAAKINAWQTGEDLDSLALDEAERRIDESGEE